MWDASKPIVTNTREGGPGTQTKREARAPREPEQLVLDSVESIEETSVVPVRRPALRGGSTRTIPACT